jgi:hypothetical protein
MRSLRSLPALPRIAIALGSTTSYGATAAGALAWSTTLGDVVAWNGFCWQLAGGFNQTVLGATNFTDAAYFESAATGIMPGATTGFGVSFSFIIEAYGAVPRAIASAYSGKGWDIRLSTGSGFTYLVGYFFDGVSYYGTAAAGFDATDIGRPFVATVTYDGAGKSHMFCRSAEYGAGTAANYAVPTTPAVVRVGRHNDPGLPGSDFTLLGIAYHSSAPTLAEYQLMNAQTLAWGGRLQTIAGKTTHLYDLTQDFVRGTAVTATLTDRIGTSNFNRVGAPALRIAA